MSGFGGFRISGMPGSRALQIAVQRLKLESFGYWDLVGFFGFSTSRLHPGFGTSS